MINRDNWNNIGGQYDYSIDILEDDRGLLFDLDEKDADTIDDCSYLFSGDVADRNFEYIPVHKDIE